MAKQLTLKNLRSYYEPGELRKSATLKTVPIMLQKDYGEEMDCTVTSLAAIFGGSDSYPLIERIAKKYGYTGKRGSNPVVVRKIMAEIMKELGVHGTPRSAYGKNICWKFDTIQMILSRNEPVILNLWDDGRHYYHDHTVTVIGMRLYEHGRFLVVYDNWNKTPGLIDYDKLSVISSINWKE